MRAGERAYRELRADIVSWRLTPGQVLGEVDLSERLGISRTLSLIHISEPTRPAA